MDPCGKLLHRPHLHLTEQDLSLAVALASRPDWLHRQGPKVRAGSDQGEGSPLRDASLKKKQNKNKNGLETEIFNLSFLLEAQFFSVPDASHTHSVFGNGSVSRRLRPLLDCVGTTLLQHQSSQPAEQLHQ